MRLATGPIPGKALQNNPTGFKFADSFDDYLVLEPRMQEAWRLLKDNSSFLFILITGSALRQGDAGRRRGF